VDDFVRTLLPSVFAIALTTLAAPAAAQDVSDPGCATIEEWVSPLTTVRGRAAGGEALNRQSELLEQTFSDAETEPVFGVAFSRWQLPQYESASAIMERCLAEVRSRRDAEMTTKVGMASGRIQDRLQRLQAASRNNPAPSRTAMAKVDHPDCETLQTWAGILMTPDDQRKAAMEGLDQVAMAEQRREQLLSDAEIEPRFGYPISEWTYNDFLYASNPITRCSGEARTAGDMDASHQLRNAYGIIRRLGNEMR